MKYFEFFQNFQINQNDLICLRGIKSRSAIVRFFLEAALNEETGHQILQYSDSTYEKWFTGKRCPSLEIWNSIVNNHDEIYFTNRLISVLNDNALPSLFQKFGITSSQTTDNQNKYAFATAISTQFFALAEGRGEAANIMDFTYNKIINKTSFPDYIKKSKQSLSCLKTILYNTEEVPFYDFFVCNTIRTKSANSRNYDSIEYITSEKLKEYSRCVLLIGMAGVGKSMIMRHLFLSSANNYKKGKLFPILVYLRQFGDQSNDLLELITDSVRKFDLSFSNEHLIKMLQNGDMLLLLDGLDEIASENIPSFMYQLDRIIEYSLSNQFIVSTRDFSSFIELSSFKLFHISPFSMKQSLELINKLVYYPEEPQLKETFYKEIKNEYYITHREFVSNPLLLTIMLMSYQRFADIPRKKYLFYEQAYQTLLYRHDANKLAYKRIFHSEIDSSDFTELLREFSAKSYRHGDYEFTYQTFEIYFNKIKSHIRIDAPALTTENFLYDVCVNVSLMFKEGPYYHFLHRSFQEYFFADYYSRQDDIVLTKLANYYSEKRLYNFDNYNAFAILYELSPQKVERFFFIPFLGKIFNSSNCFYSFIEICYPSWGYIPYSKLCENFIKSKSISEGTNTRDFLNMSRKDADFIKMVSDEGLYFVFDSAPFFMRLLERLISEPYSNDPYPFFIDSKPDIPRPQKKIWRDFDYDTSKYRTYYTAGFEELRTDNYISMFYSSESEDVNAQDVIKWIQFNDVKCLPIYKYYLKIKEYYHKSKAKLSLIDNDDDF